MSDSTFQREDRYIVLKLKRLPNDEAEYLRDCHAKAMVECVVVERDWPEYNFVWAMIEHRMAGKSVPDFNLWRRANELQERLNAADQRIDELTAAAEPFAKVADLYVGEEDDSHEPGRDVGMHDDLRLTLGHFRALNDLCTKPLIKS